MQVAYHRAMNETEKKISEMETDEPAPESPRRLRRRIKLGELINFSGGASRVAQTSGTPKSHISALLSGKRGIGDVWAARVEKLYSLPLGWFDSDPGYVDEVTTPTARGVPQGKRSGSNLGLSRPAAPMDVATAFEVLGKSLAQLDEIGRQQIQPLFEALIKNPENAIQYGKRYTASFSAAQQDDSLET